MSTLARLSLILTLVFILILSSCLPGPNPLEKKASPTGKVAGFWKGLWHGLLSPLTFIISLFARNVRF